MVPHFVIRDVRSEGDANAIAAVHAESWRTAYRGILSDAYLDGPIDAERRRLWRARCCGQAPATGVAFNWGIGGGFSRAPTAPPVP